MVRNIVLVSCIAVSVFISNQIVYAQSNASSSTGTKAVILANVDMYSPSVVQAKDGTVSVVFILKALDRNQSGVYYSIQLTNNEGKKVYEYVFPKSVSLVKNELITVKDSFIPPASLQGDFSVMIQATNDAGLPLAFGSVDKVSMVASSEKTFTSITSCTSEKETITMEDSLLVTCEYKGDPTENSKITSNVYRGNEKTPSDTQTVSLAASEGNITIPAQATGGSYTVVLQSYEGTMPVGDTQTVGFAVEGFSAKVASVSPDKEQYVAGEQATVTVGLAVYSTEGVKNIFSDAVMKNFKGEVCAISSKTPITNPGSVILSMPVSATCDGYTLTVSLTDENGVTLDTKTIETPAQEKFSMSSLFGDPYSSVRYIWYGVLLILLIALGVHFFTKKPSVV